MEVEATAIPEVKLVKPKVFGDARGYFLETFELARYHEHGIPALNARFVQDNISHSAQGILRGLHLQHPFAQGKLVMAVRGTVFDVAVDVRVGSPTFGQHVSAILSDENHHQLWVPPGFAHGFTVLSEEATFAYKCTDVYHPETELSVLWNDPALSIAWPVTSRKLSKKDEAGIPLASIDPARLPTYESYR